MFEGLKPQIITGVFALLGALFGALLTFILQRHFHARRSIRVFSSPLVNLTSTLENLGMAITLKKGRQPITSLRRMQIIVWNTGNRAVENLQIDFTFNAKTEVLHSRDQVEQAGLFFAYSKQPQDDVDHRITLKFINPGEKASTEYFLNTSATDCKLVCRQPDLKVLYVANVNYQTLAESFLEASLAVGSLESYLRVLKLLFARAPSPFK